MAVTASILAWRRNGGISLRPYYISVALFVIVAAALVAAIFLLFSTIEAERVQRSRLARTNEILLALRAIDTTAITGETGQRGYFITADKRYLEPYSRALRQAPLAIVRLRNLIGPDAPARQQALVDEIDRLSDAKWGELADTVALVEEGKIPEAHARILSDEGQIAMTRLRAAIGQLERIERADLNEALHKTSDAEGRVGPALVVLAGGLLAGLGLGLGLLIHTSRVEAEAANAKALAAARDRADLLAHELNHRVKNLFAVTLAIVKLSARDVPEAKAVIERISGRIHALARAHQVTQGHSDNGRASLEELVRVAVAPYTSATAHCDVQGEDVFLCERNTVPLGLVLHELVTNAVKYGAWSEPGGVVRVRWQKVADRVSLEWEEQSVREVQEPAKRTGFGSVLIDSAARQMSGVVERHYRPLGLLVRLNFPTE